MDKSSFRVEHNLRTYRKRMAFGQKRVARLLGHAAPGQVSRFERGARLPNFVTALKLGIIYRVEVEFLFRDLYLQLKEEIRAKEEASAAGRGE